MTFHDKTACVASILAGVGGCAWLQHSPLLPLPRLLAQSIVTFAMVQMLLHFAG